ncbi:helix-turn-helix domain-containing protein [Agromyces aerolatus]|uniref:helix-turn-helix domain-containing protein n=1 Tax=Agromyces sp. LY-1074 TaxID=3074080 RepID=UPI002858ACF2|nr:MULTISPECIES: helix-turn-helix domain-containing protein [unclassified Agromyces]MDR5699854.1 helix-turn-helix domain-containing protein [Agromyces sp. LY-1074]MDR5706334.1 helix-turn-helix domain-containing protein [Agromyces sp. LY-1358]
MATTPARRGTLLNIEEVAEYLNTTVRNVRRITQARAVPTVIIGRRVMVWTHDLDTYIEANTRPAVTR